MNERFDLVVIGAGPTGLACAIEAQKVGFRAVNVDKGCLVNSLYNYPANMVFFTTPELLEIGDIPFTTAHQKPTRSEALEYYRKVTEHYRLDVRQYENVEKVSGADGDFVINALDRASNARQYHARKLVVATGFYDLPNILGIPGEKLSKVVHYYGVLEEFRISRIRELHADGSLQTRFTTVTRTAERNPNRLLLHGSSVLAMPSATCVGRARGSWEPRGQYHGAGKGRPSQDDTIPSGCWGEHHVPGARSLCVSSQKGSKPWNRQQAPPSRGTLFS